MLNPQKRQINYSYRTTKMAIILRRGGFVCGLLRGFCSGVGGSVFTGSLTGACSGGLPGSVSGAAVSGTFVVLSSGIHVYLLILGMKKEA